MVHVPFYKSKAIAKGKIPLYKQDILPVGRYNRPGKLKKRINQRVIPCRETRKIKIIEKKYCISEINVFLCRGMMAH